jgi:hypothetical protein
MYCNALMDPLPMQAPSRLGFSAMVTRSLPDLRATTPRLTLPIPSAFLSFVSDADAVFIPPLALLPISRAEIEVFSSQSIATRITLVSADTQQATWSGANGCPSRALAETCIWETVRPRGLRSIRTMADDGSNHRSMVFYLQDPRQQARCRLLGWSPCTYFNTNVSVWWLRPVASTAKVHTNLKCIQAKSRFS